MFGCCPDERPVAWFDAVNGFDMNVDVADMAVVYRLRFRSYNKCVVLLIKRCQHSVDIRGKLEGKSEENAYAE